MAAKPGKGREVGVARKRGRKGRADPSAGYAPTRAAKLRTPDNTPPPLPPAATDDAEGFGSDAGDGLRMLAALETLTSLEPDYSDDLAAEASVTIIDAAGHDLVAAAFSAEPDDYRARRRRLEPQAASPESSLLLNGYETFLGPGDEAIVEIVEPAEADDAPAAPVKSSSAQPASLTERLAAATGPGARFLKALSGG